MTALIPTVSSDQLEALAHRHGGVIELDPESGTGFLFVNGVVIAEAKS